MFSYLIALEIPPLIQQQLMLSCNGLPSMNWIEQDNLHLIIRYLGTPNDYTLYEIKDRLSKLSFNFTSLEITLKGIEASISKRKHYQLHVGVAPSESIIKIKREIDNHLNSLDLPASEKSYKPHITIGSGEQINSNKLADYLAYHAFYQTPSMHLDHLTLFQVQNTPKRVLYHKIGYYPFLLRKEERQSL